MTANEVTATVDRVDLVAAQTPQGVRRALLRSALATSLATGGIWTDEAALLEACTIPVHVIPGDPTNLKVTVPTDLARVAQVLALPTLARPMRPTDRNIGGSARGCQNRPAMLCNGGST